MALVVTRRGLAAADYLAARISGTYLLHPLLRQSHLTAPELPNTALAFLEAPPQSEQQYEHCMLKLVAKVRAAGPEVVVVVQPSLRRTSQRSLWVHRWNLLSTTPFKFQQTCTCCPGQYNS